MLKHQRWLPCNGQFLYCSQRLTRRSCQSFSNTSCCNHHLLFTVLCTSSLVDQACTHTYRGVNMSSKGKRRSHERNTSLSTLEEYLIGTNFVEVDLLSRWIFDSGFGCNDVNHILSTRRDDLLTAHLKYDRYCKPKAVLQLYNITVIIHNTDSKLNYDLLMLESFN